MLQHLCNNQHRKASDLAFSYFALLQASPVVIVPRLSSYLLIPSSSLIMHQLTTCMFPFIMMTPFGLSDSFVSRGIFCGFDNVIHFPNTDIKYLGLFGPSSAKGESCDKLPGRIFFQTVFSSFVLQAISDPYPQPFWFYRFYTTFFFQT
jgi:hypothetical protein